MARLTVVSGFLGAGKTTLLRQLVARSLARGERSVVIENEFGAVGLDADVLSREGVPVYELNQGCVCCTLKNDFAATLERILADLRPDRVFFEPSGIFIPDSLLAIVRAPQIAARCQLAPFITVVDALAWSTRRERYGSFFARQVAFADILALTRCECVDEPTRDGLRAQLCGANARARQCVVDRTATLPALLDAVLDGTEESVTSVDRPCARAYSALSVLRAAPAGIRYRRSRAATHGYSALSVPLSPAMRAEDLARLLATLQSGRYGRIERAKGWLGDEGGPGSFSLAAGQLEFATQPVPQRAGERSDPVIVVIGEGLDRRSIRRLLSGGDPAGEGDPGRQECVLAS
jgi:G3E family GTPase